MIDERLALGVVLGSVESLTEHFLGQAQVRHLRVAEAGIEREHGSAVLQAVTGQLQLILGSYVLDGEFESGSIGGLRQPHVEVLTLARLEVNEVVARSLEAKLIDLLLSLLSLDLVLLLRVRKQQDKVLEELSEFADHATLGDHEDSLSVLPFFRFGLGILEGSELLVGVDGHLLFFFLLRLF
eukprot:CAMPEP_0170495230 /NCGR_PEP_ID=MMETSP0208-20121228/15091_1 /TAXON_ID=197538 /ORGANISM="Strombidium inclinatum, Strain S3" /LENGTH=182 /DNA_ID=CAMNT_0010771389 /DNA_START=286 /DNA_END=834 /DNA_ORIENTATION=+